MVPPRNNTLERTSASAYGLQRSPLNVVFAGPQEEPSALLRRVGLTVIGMVAACTAVAGRRSGSVAQPAEIAFIRLRTGIVHVGAAVAQGEPAWLGTGFLVDRACTFVTAKHVVGGRKDGLVIRLLADEQGKVVTQPARLLQEAPDRDLAFLRVDRVRDRPCETGTMHVYPLPEAKPGPDVVGAGVLIIGHPVLASGQNIDMPVLRRGHLSSVELLMDQRPMLLLDLHGVPGFSGSPVVLESTGEAIGLIYGPGPIQRGFGFEWATPITRTEYDAAVANRK